MRRPDLGPGELIPQSGPSSVWTADDRAQVPLLPDCWVTEGRWHLVRTQKLQLLYSSDPFSSCQFVSSKQQAPEHNTWKWKKAGLLSQTIYEVLRCRKENVNKQTNTLPKQMRKKTPEKLKADFLKGRLWEMQIKGLKNFWAILQSEFWNWCPLIWDLVGKSQINEK